MSAGTRLRAVVAANIATVLAVLIASPAKGAPQGVPAHASATLVASTDSTSVYVDLVNVHKMKGAQQYMAVVYVDATLPSVEQQQPTAPRVLGQSAETWLIDCARTVMVRHDVTRRDPFGRELSYTLDNASIPKGAERGSIAAEILASVCLVERGHT